MARRLVQLKLRLLRNALHASTAAQVSFLVSTTLAILVAIGTFVVLALFRGQSVSVDVTSVTFTVFVFGWLILPIFAFSLDSTLDPATLAIYPPDLRVVRVLCPGGAQGGRRRQVQCCDAEGSGAVELAPSRQGAASHLTMGVSCRNRRERAKSMRRREGRRGSALGFHSGIASVSWLNY